MLFNFFVAISTFYSFARRRAATNDCCVYDIVMWWMFNCSIYYCEFVCVLINFILNIIGLLFAFRRIIWRCWLNSGGRGANRDNFGLFLYFKLVLMSVLCFVFGFMFVKSLFKFVIKFLFGFNFVLNGLSFSYSMS